MEIGLEAAGFDPIACLELDANAQNTLRRNRPTWNVLPDGDVIASSNVLKPRDFGLNPGELDLLSGGPPCQPFSTAAQWSANGRRGMGDVRAGTVNAILNFADSFTPKAVMLENVYGFVAGKNSALATLESGFSRINAARGTSYTLHWRLMNAADFGVPQNRKRVIVVALRDGSAPTWPTATHTDTPRTAGDAFAGLDKQDLPPLRGKWADLLPAIPEGENYQWLTSRGGGPEIFGYRTKYWNFLLKLSADLPSWTLAASPGPSTGPFHWDNRPLTPREMMRLQTFPDDWMLTGDFRAQTKLVGNATPALLSERVGRSIRHHLYPDAISTESTLGVYPARSVSHLPTSLRGIPERHHALIGSKASHAGAGLGPAPRMERPSAQVPD